MLKKTFFKFVFQKWLFGNTRYAYKNFTFCLNPKAGSTNLKTIIYLMEHGVEKVQNDGSKLMDQFLQPFNVNPPFSVLKNMPLVTIVREPLLRFLASYKDKIERCLFVFIKLSSPDCQWKLGLIRTRAEFWETKVSLYRKI